MSPARIRSLPFTVFDPCAAVAKRTASWPAPAATVSAHEFVRFSRSPTSRLVVGKVFRFGPAPGLDDRIHQKPCRFHPIMARKKRRISLDTIFQQGLIGFRGGAAEAFLVVEIQTEGAHANIRSRGFNFKRQ